MSLESTHFADSGRLLARIEHAVREQRGITFLFGSALTAPGGGPKEFGVPGAAAMIETVRELFTDVDELESLDSLLQKSSGSDRYEAMRFVIDCRGQDALNALIRNAVLKARLQPPPLNYNVQDVELDASGWNLRPAVEAVGHLYAEHPQIFSKPILTSNFDPLIEVSIRRAGCQAMAIFLAADGQFSNVFAPDTFKVVHFHGYWHGSDTLHTPTQLTRNRPHLKGCLRSLLRETILVVMGYGGWSDVFTKTLIEVISEQTEQLNVLWTFYSDNAEDILTTNQKLLEQLQPLSGQRVLFYKGVDCHVHLPRLRDKLIQHRSASAPIVIEAAIAENTAVAITRIEDAGNHPPQINAWVGREAELRTMLSSCAKVITISGIGGCGKSALAAKYLEQRKGAEEISVWYWADCREESNTLHTQLTRLVERVSNGEISAQHLKGAATEEIVDILLSALGDAHAVIVFDNIDHYIDVEEFSAIGAMKSLINQALQTDHPAQFIFTGRPQIEMVNPKFLHIHLLGLSIDETKRLFEMRGVLLEIATAANKINEVHALTGGHPLALNLIATQVAKNKVNFNELLIKLKNGVAEGIENPVLPNIWVTLNPKQQTVLRYLAELIHPQTEQRIASYLGNALNYNQFNKAVKVLKSLDLIVVKSPGESLPDTLELHPLIRDFVRRKFPTEERIPYIDSIILSCDRMIGKFRDVLDQAPYSVLENWTSKVELCLQSQRYPQAMETLSEVCSSLCGGGYSEEFVRLATELLKFYSPNPQTKNLAHYDNVTKELSESLSQLGRYKESELVIERFEKTIEGKSARYILLCDMQAHHYWIQSDFSRAIEWATRGVELKQNSKLDTQHDCSHTLALAQRDSGLIEPALKYFLGGVKLEDVLDGNSKSSQNFSGIFFGNVGRCLQFLDRKNEALYCLRKSAYYLEQTINSDTQLNRGYAAFWIAELAEALENFEISYSAYRCASFLWRRISPPKSRRAADGADRARELLPRDVDIPLNDWECEQVYSKWIRAK